ncbi:hypothetical protein MCBRY_000097 [Methylocystis bryophila]|jgi:hypothetical protein
MSATEIVLIILGLIVLGLILFNLRDLIRYLKIMSM